MSKFDQISEVLKYVNTRSSSLGDRMSARYQTVLSNFAERDLQLRELIHRQKHMAEEVWRFCEIRGEGFFKYFLTSVYHEFDFSKARHHESLNTVARIKKIRLKRVDKVHHIHFILLLLKAEEEFHLELYEPIREIEKFRGLLLRHCEKRLEMRTFKASSTLIDAAMNGQDSKEAIERSFSQDEIDLMVRLKTEMEELLRTVENHKISEDLQYMNRASIPPKNPKRKLENALVERNDSKEIEPKRPENEISEKPPLWIERMDALLTDEFRYQLKESITVSLWSEIRHGDFGDPIKFFEYFDGLIRWVYEYKEKPSELRGYLEELNPTSLQYSLGGIASEVAASYLPVLRQQVFILNALRLVISARCVTDDSLKIASSIIKTLLHHKVSGAIRNIGMMSKEPAWQYLANRIDKQHSLAVKAHEIVLFLSETLEKHNLKANDDSRDALLFIREQLEIPYDLITQNNNRFTNVFGADWKLQSYCATLYYEYYRLIELARLEQFEHKIPKQSDQGQSNSSGEVIERENEEKSKTLRQKLLLLLCTTFGKPELPPELVKRRALEVFQPLIGGSEKNLYDLLTNPTKCSGGKRAIKSLCEDLHFVRDQLGKLGMSDKITNAINEIEFLIDELEENTEIN